MKSLGLFSQPNISAYFTEDNNFPVSRLMYRQATANYDGNLDAWCTYRYRAILHVTKFRFFNLS